ncbi:MAG: TonB-dependent receptor, partial [Holophagales bacterium]|nr:TonB-dependent receptor [Holophagales bacterium]
RYVDEQFISPDNGFAIDSAALLDAAVFFNWNRAQLNLNLFNLTDEEYETRAQGRAAVRPAPGFEARAGVRLLF